MTDYEKLVFTITLAYTIYNKLSSTPTLTHDEFFQEYMKYLDDCAESINKINLL